MLWFLIRTVIWIAGFIVVASYILNYFGYQPNWDYLEERSSSCQEALNHCKNDLLEKSKRDDVEAIRSTCHIDCISPKLFIQKNR